MYVIQLFQAIPSSFWALLGLLIPFIITWRNQRRSFNNEKNIITIVKDLQEAHKHEPFFISLQIKLEDRLIFKTKNSKNTYIQNILSRALVMFAPYFYEILKSDFTIAKRESIVNRMSSYLETLIDSIDYDKLNIGSEQRFEYSQSLNKSMERIFY